MQSRIPMHRGMFLCTEQAARVIGVASSTVWRWAERKVTSYDFPLRVVKDKDAGHVFISERDVRIAERVQRDFPLQGGGPIKKARRELMKAYALRLKAAAPRA